MHLKKKAGGGSITRDGETYEWASDGAVTEVPDDLGAELLTIRGGGYEAVSGEGVSEDDAKAHAERARNAQDDSRTDPYPLPLRGIPAHGHGALTAEVQGAYARQGADPDGDESADYSGGRPAGKGLPAAGLLGVPGAASAGTVTDPSSGGRVATPPVGPDGKPAQAPDAVTPQADPRFDADGRPKGDPDAVADEGNGEREDDAERKDSAPPAVKAARSTRK